MAIQLQELVVKLSNKISANDFNPNQEVEFIICTPDGQLVSCFVTEKTAKHMAKAMKMLGGNS